MSSDNYTHLFCKEALGLIKDEIDYSLHPLIEQWFGQLDSSHNAEEVKENFDHSATAYKRQPEPRP